MLESIQESIRDGEFRPGEALPSERELAERYGVGKSSIREAVKMLQVLGVVETAQGRGTYLRRSVGPQILRPLLLDMMLLRTSADELYEFRLFFDRAYLRLAAEKATDEDKRRAREAFEGLKAYAGRMQGVERVELLPYHILGAHKYEAMGIPYPLAGMPPMDPEKCRALQEKYFPAST